jgi:hypothetical protein
VRGPPPRGGGGRGEAEGVGDEGRVVHGKEHEERERGEHGGAEQQVRQRRHQVLIGARRAPPCRSSLTPLAAASTALPGISGTLLLSSPGGGGELVAVRRGRGPSEASELAVAGPGGLRRNWLERASA